MTETRKLMPWSEWQKKAWAGMVMENQEPCPRPSGIECPMTEKVNDKYIKCAGQLTDTTAVMECGSEPRRVVHCAKCGAWMCRLLGAKPEDGNRVRFWVARTFWPFIAWSFKVRYGI